MTINEFVNLLKKHNVDFDKDLFVVAPNEDDDGADFDIEENGLAVFLVKREWNETITHVFLDEEEQK